VRDRHRARCPPRRDRPRDPRRAARHLQASGDPMSDPLQLLGDISGPAQAIVDIVNDEVVPVTAIRAAYLWDRDKFDAIPCVTVGLPALRQVKLDEAESQLGAVDWWLDYPCSIYFELGNQPVPVQ